MTELQKLLAFALKRHGLDERRIAKEFRISIHTIRYLLADAKRPIAMPANITSKEIDLRAEIIMGKYPK